MLSCGSFDRESRDIGRGFSSCAIIVIHNSLSSPLAVVVEFSIGELSFSIPFVIDIDFVPVLTKKSMD
jgi:hypothetical protein